MKTINLGLSTALILPLLSVYGQTPAPENNNPTLASAPTVPVNISPGTAEVIRLAGAGTGDDVINAYIQNSSTPFNLSADQILYLRDIGVSSPMITAMLNRDNALRGQPQPYTYEQKLYSPSAPPPPPPQVAPVADPAPVAEPAPTPEPVAAPTAAQAAPPVYVSSPPPEATYFYSDLSPYGTWVQLDGVGWCWQPRVVLVNHAWQPYCDAGHWVYTDAGWCWASDYSWGWAPFHYGRWHLHAGCGWVWVPDRVWAPAWVIWRSEGDYCGWAPLPPHAEFIAGVGWRFNGISVGLTFDFGLHPEHYTFVALHDFHERDFAHYRLPGTQVTQIYNHTTIINNYVVKNNTVINQGIKVDRVAAATHTTIRPVHLRDAPGVAPKSLNSQAAQKGELMVYRPQLKPPAKPVVMVAQKIDQQHPVIQHQPVGSPASATHNPVTANRVQQTQTTRTTSSSPNYNSRSANPSGSPAASSRNVESPHENSARETSEGNAASSKAANAQPYGPHSGAQNPYNYGRDNTPGQASGSYYPNGYHQAADAHALPQTNEQQGDRSTAPNSKHTQSKKSDQ